jgi:hypothetical protein
MAQPGQRGSFYLGGLIGSDPAADPAADPLLYDARDLTTHGVILGMTGSGKTGLALGLLEESLLSGIPVLALDPKGDLTNLLLTFPELRPEDFRPWINEADAARSNLSADEFAAKAAETWRAGLASWGLGPDRIRQLKAGADFAIYTPGSKAGLPLNVMGSLDPPPLSWDTEDEALRDEIEGFVTSLLGMAGIDADPIAGREHILLANLIERSWRAGSALDLGALIQQIQQPPFRKLGVFDVDTFFPPKDRTALALRLNGLMASPSFAEWLEGAPLDPAVLLGAPGGRPRASIVYLAHLSDAESQFVVTLILSKVVTWMRGLQGTTDLRALVYMDEVFGFVPPTASPPPKKVILTILKQARAFGVGLVLATQNPVDLDYKAMSNAGTWWIGRLQTERDKARILEGLSSASGGLDVSLLDPMISGLEQRRFVLHRAGQSPARVFASRWDMSYLRGPLTKEQITTLMADVPTTPAGAPSAATATAGSAVQAVPASPIADGALGDVSSVAPSVAEGVPVFFLDPAAPWGAIVHAAVNATRLEPALVARVRLRFDDAKAGVDHAEEWEAVFFPLADSFDPASGTAVDYDDRDLRAEAPPGARYRLPAAPVSRVAYFRKAATDLRSHLARTRSVTVFRNSTLKLYARPGEGRADFAARCQAVANEGADRDAARIRDRLEARKDRLQETLDTARRRADQAAADASAREQQEMVAGAGTILGVLLGGRGSARSIAGRASRALGGVTSRRSASARASQRVDSAREAAASKEAELERLEQEILDELREITDIWAAKAAQIDEIQIGLESTDVTVDRIGLLWIPTA